MFTIRCRGKKNKPDKTAYAPLASLPPEYDLYAGIMAPLAFFVFATSCHASVAPSSSEAIMVAVFSGAKQKFSFGAGPGSKVLYEETNELQGFSSDKKVI